MKFLLKMAKKAAVCLVAGWFLTLSALLIRDGGGFTDKAFGQSRSLTVVLASLAIGAVFWILWGFFPQIWPKVLLFSALILAATAFAFYPDAYFALGLLLAVFLVCLFIRSEKKEKLAEESVINKEPPKKNPKVKLWFWVLGVFFLVFVGGLATLRYLNFFTPNFDFGLFCNMFHNMREGFLPMVTSERDGLLSHFAVHISPIYYLLLPFYMLFPSPITLQISQAALLASGLVPLYLLGRKFKLSNAALCALAAAYVFFPALAGGTFYDLHENKFLTPLLLWLAWGFERKKWPFVYLFALLVCFVKEDAPVYVMFFALYLLIARREYRHGPILFAGALAYFLGALALLSAYGEGAMTYRYDNVVHAGGLFGVFKTALVNPLLLVKESFEPAKLAFAFLMLAPLGFLPLLTSRLSSYILIAPMMLINLIPDYQYQHSIYFQYTYGVSGLLFYLSVQNAAALENRLEAWKKPWRNTAKTSAALALCLLSAGFFAAKIGPRVTYLDHYLTHTEQRFAIAQALDNIPQEASVQASTFFVARIAQRSEIYEHPSRHATEYVVLDLRYFTKERAGAEVDALERRGFTLVDYTENAIAVLHKAVWAGE